MSLRMLSTEHANLEGIYAYLETTPLSFQEEIFVLAVFKGQSIRAGERAAGMGKGRGRKILEQENTGKILNYLRTQMYADARINLELLNSMTLEAHAKSVSATEELTAIGTLAKLNMIGGFAPVPIVQRRIEEMDKNNGEKDVTPPKTAKELEAMDEDDLLTLAAFDNLDNLNPTPDTRKTEPKEPIEGEYAIAAVDDYDEDLYAEAGFPPPVPKQVPPIEPEPDGSNRTEL